MGKLTDDVRSQKGYTLVELLLAMSAGLLVLGALMGGLVATGRGESAVTARTDATQRARVGLERMTRELRHAESVAVPTASRLLLGVPVRNTTNVVQVVYECSTGRCTRTEGTDPAVTLIAGVTDPAVFVAQIAPSGEVAYVDINLVARAAHVRDAAAQTRATGLSADLTFRHGIAVRNAR